MVIKVAAMIPSSEKTACLLKVSKVVKVLNNVRRACGYVDVGTCPHQVLAATLTLSQPGGQIMPTLYWCPHQVLKATGAPE